MRLALGLALLLALTASAAEEKPTISVLDPQVTRLGKEDAEIVAEAIRRSTGTAPMMLTDSGEIPPLLPVVDLALGWAWF